MFGLANSRDTRPVFAAAHWGWIAALTLGLVTVVLAYAPPSLAGVVQRVLAVPTLLAWPASIALVGVSIGADFESVGVLALLALINAFWWAILGAAFVGTRMLLRKMRAAKKGLQR